VVFIFLISVSHALLLAAFIRLRRREPDLARSYRAIGGTPVAAVALILSLSVMVSCYRLEVRALQIAIAAIALLVAQFLWLKPARFREHEA
jgi:ethanolamine permease